MSNETHVLVSRRRQIYALGLCQELDGMNRALRFHRSNVIVFFPLWGPHIDIYVLILKCFYYPGSLLGGRNVYVHYESHGNNSNNAGPS
jgi:hypothetical protein